MQNDLIKQLEVSRKRLIEALSGISGEGIVTDQWGKKEILAHIAGWEEEGMICISQILRGEEPRSFRTSIDRFNQENVERRKDTSIPELLQELLILRSDFIKQIKELSEEQITGYYGTRLKGKRINVLWIINEAISHDNNHTKELVKGRIF